MQRIEIPQNTPEQVTEYLTVALRLTEDLDVPEELRPAFFTAAVALVGAKQVVLQQPQQVDLGAIQRRMEIPGNGRR